MNRPDRPCLERIRDPQVELQKVLDELAKLPASYSQSNPGIYMAYRDLNRRIAALEAEIKALKK